MAWEFKFFFLIIEVWGVGRRIYLILNCMVNKQKVGPTKPVSSQNPANRVVSPQQPSSSLCSSLQSILILEAQWMPLTSFEHSPQAQLLLQVAEESSSLTFRHISCLNSSLCLRKWLSPVVVAPHVFLTVFVLAIIQEYQQLSARSLAERHVGNLEALSFCS